MIETMTAIAEQVTNTTSLDKEHLCEVFREYFMNGDGGRFNPISENRPKKPAKKLRTFLENLGLIKTFKYGMADNLDFTNTCINPFFHVKSLEEIEITVDLLKGIDS